METNDLHCIQHTRDFEAEMNSRPINRVKITQSTKCDGRIGRENCLDGCSIATSFPTIGAAVLPVTWIVCALESQCLALTHVGFAYSNEGHVHVEFNLSSGTSVSRGMYQFIDEMSTTPRSAVFAWNTEMLPDSTRIAVEAIINASHFEKTGKHIRRALLNHAPMYIPEVRIPCSNPPAREPREEWRSSVTSTLQRLRSGFSFGKKMNYWGNK